MEQTYFYLTITGNGNAHKIKEQYNLNEFQAHNKGDYDECYGFLQYQTMCLRYPYNDKVENLDYIFNSNRVTRLLNLPKEFKITLHCVCHISTDRQSHGIFIDIRTLKDLALLGADFVMYGKLYFLPLQYDFPNTILHQEIFAKETKITPCQLAYLSVHSYRFSLDEISEKLGFNYNDRSYNVGDITKTGRFREFSRFSYQSLMGNDLNEKIKNLADEISLYKDNILSSANDMDIECWVNVSGSMPNEYQLNIDSDTLNKFAQMRLSLDFDMYFANGY